MATKPQFCTECGSALTDKANCTNPNCKNFISAEAKSAETPTQFSFLSLKKMKENLIEKNKQIVPDCINSERDEMPVRQYDVARLQSLIICAFAAGQLQVTNKRVMFRSSGISLLGRNSLQYEFALEEIAGIEFRKEARFNLFTALLLLIITWFIYLIFGPVFSPMHNSTFLSVIFSALMAFGSILTGILLRKRKYLSHAILSVCATGLLTGYNLVQFFSGHTSLWGMVMGIVVYGILLINGILLAFAPNLVIAVKTKGGTPSIEIRKKDGLLSKRKNEYTGFSQVMPGPDVDLAMKELGAVIRQVQQTGTYEAE